MDPWQDTSTTQPKTSCAKFGQADERAAAGKNSDEIAVELHISPATVYNWRGQHGGMNVDLVKELEELRERSNRLKRLTTRGTSGECCVTWGARGGQSGVGDPTVSGYRTPVMRLGAYYRHSPV
ncbi:transposase [Williamsia sterculiae]|uniref:transposase n=1 Tax=Williamsia sterculiae TaxID=1344003 RepID=UPI00117C0214